MSSDGILSASRLSDGARTFFAAYVGLVGTSLLINAPGRTNTDMMVILYQARNPSELSDWHSPFVTYLEGLFGPVFGWPMGALVLQSLLLLTWPAMMLAVVLRGGPSATRSLLLAIWALVACLQLVLAGQTNKDILGLAFASLAFATVLARDRNIFQLTHRQAFAIAAPALVAFALVRPNNLAVVAAVLLAYALLFGGLSRRRALATATGVIVASVAALLIIPSLLGARISHPEQTPIAFDLAGMSTALHQDLFADFVPPDTSRQPPWDCYTPMSSDDFFWGRCKSYGPVLDSYGGRLKRIWLKQLAAHPVAYLRHRRRFAGELLFARDCGSLVPSPPDFSHAANSAGSMKGETAEWSNGVAAWRPLLSFVPFGRIASFVICQTIVGRSLAWIAVLLVLPLATIRWQDISRRLSVLSVGGLSNLLVILALAPSADTRYLLPTFWCALASSLMVTAQLFGSTSHSQGSIEPGVSK